MEFQKHFRMMKELQQVLIDFIDDENDDENYGNLKKLIDNQDIRSNIDELKSFLYMISKISKNHNRQNNFIEKIEKVLTLLKEEMNELLMNEEIFNIFKNNKRILLFLFEEQILYSNESIVEIMSQPKYEKRNYLLYFYNEVQKHIENGTRNEIEARLSRIFPDLDEEFEEKRKIGENDNYLCSVIRKDDIDEFIIYVNQRNISLSSKITNAIFETNSFLIKKDPTIIEYTAFFGSIQIFRYLCLNRVKLNPSLWHYVIHSRNPELIHICEEYCIEQNDVRSIQIESIKCYHKEITEYIINTTDSSQLCDSNTLFKLGIRFYNFEYFSNINGNESIFYECCRFNHTFIINTLLENSKFSFDLNKALKAASEKENDEIIQTLIKYKGIPDRAFSECKSLQKIEIPSFIKSIGISGFDGCSKLREIKIPESVTFIGNLAFQNCSSLIRIEIPESVKSIGNGTFSGCLSLTRIKLPLKLESIGTNAFFKCSSLTEIALPQKVKIIEDYTFFECKSLQKVILPYQINSIGNFAFWGCLNLKKLLIPSSLTSIGIYAFSSCESINKIVIPFSVKKIGNSAFEQCTKLSEISINSDISTISESLFSGCSNLKIINIPPSVKKIEDSAFWSCTSLNNVEIPESVETIQNSAFWGCSCLEKISITHVKNIGEYAFSGCSKLKVLNHSNLGSKSIGKCAFPEGFGQKNTVFNSGRNMVCC